ncbi:MAG: tripartite tricarboxylate transporter substrate-binding protein [Armatimonadota bacterium]|nr:tripartite tricarboxylate transporter substrate-binding protein [Armatimonadota bacterium]
MTTLARLKPAIFLALFYLAWFVDLRGALHAQTEPFYKGKTIRIVVGVSPGGAYDQWARLIAPYMSKYIPGSPQIIIQNMPGAGTITAANYVYNVAKPDGLTLVMPANRLYIDQVVGRDEVKFDVRKFLWIGTPQTYYTVIYMRADAPYKSMADIIKAKEPPRCGAPGTTSAGYTLSQLWEETMGAKFKFVLGYPGASEIDLAVERGEVICRGHDIVNHFSGSTYRTWHEKGFDRHIVQDGPKRDPKLPDTPTIFELMDHYKTPQTARRVAEFISASAQFGRPMMTTPGTPEARVKLLREAYVKVTKDPEFISQVEKAKLHLDPATGEELEALAHRIMDQPPQAIEKVRKILAE